MTKHIILFSKRTQKKSAAQKQHSLTPTISPQWLFRRHSGLSWILHGSLSVFSKNNQSPLHIRICQHKILFRFQFSLQQIQCFLSSNYLFLEFSRFISHKTSMNLYKRHTVFQKRTCICYRS